MNDERAHYIMVGGFLGAGKTTALARFAHHLTARGKRVGLICNDQSSGLVDTALLQATGLPVEEITGGCFCCRFDSLLQAAESLTRETRPDVFLAEPVGSCTDLIATVSYPLRRIYGERFRVAPLSVLVDPVRAARVLGVRDGKTFSEKVVYVYRKQLEEADVIVVNKCDAIDDALRTELVAALERAFPKATIYCCSVKDGTDVELWFDHVSGAAVGTASPLEIDYDVYADGEALLGWLNCTVRVAAASPIDGNQLLLRLATGIRDRIAAHDGGIAHLKMTLDAGDATGMLSVVSLVGTDEAPDLRESVFDRVDGGSLVINLRAEADPALLESLTREALDAESEIDATVEHLEQLRPGRPEPTHRMSAS